MREALNDPSRTIGSTTVKFKRENSDSIRPDTMELTYTIDGKTRTVSFENEAGKIPEVSNGY